MMALHIRPNAFLSFYCFVRRTFSQAILTIFNLGFMEAKTTPYTPYSISYITHDSSFHFLFHYPYITPIYIYIYTPQCYPMLPHILSTTLIETRLGWEATSEGKAKKHWCSVGQGKEKETTKSFRVWRG